MASRIVRARLDEASERGLSMLMREGRNESEAVRTALVEAADRRRQRAALAEEVRRLNENPEDVAELKAIMSDFESIEPEWPE